MKISQIQRLLEVRGVRVHRNTISRYAKCFEVTVDEIIAHFVEKKNRRKVIMGHYAKGLTVVAIGKLLGLDHRLVRYHVQQKA